MNYQIVFRKSNNLPIIISLISKLISGCRESDPEAKVLFGECLGELGAVDPGR